MRFDTLFNEYYYLRKENEKISAKDINETIKKTTKLNFWLVSIFFGLLISASIANILQFWIAVPVLITGGLWLTDIILLIVIALVNSNARTSYQRVKTAGREYSKNRIYNTISLLKEYNIDVADKKCLQLLIDEAKANKTKYDLFAQFKKPLKTVYALIVPSAVYIGQKFAELRLENESAIVLFKRLEEPVFVFFMLLILIIVLSTLVFPELDRIIKSKYYFHDEFIEDIRQIIIFSEKNNSQAK